MGGLLFVVAVVVLLALTGRFAGREQDEVECTDKEWSSYSQECNRWSPTPGRKK